MTIFKILKTNLMKNYYFLLVAFLFSFTINAQIIDILDPVLKDRLVNDNVVDLDGNGIGDADVDTNNDGEIQLTEAEAVFDQNLGSFSDNDISTLDGIEAFSNLQSLSVRGNNLTSLNVISTLSNLLTLNCDYNELT